MCMCACIGQCSKTLTDVRSVFRSAHQGLFPLISKQFSEVFAWELLTLVIFNKSQVHGEKKVHNGRSSRPIFFGERLCALKFDMTNKFGSRQLLLVEYKLKLMKELLAPPSSPSLVWFVFAVDGNYES